MALKNDPGFIASGTLHGVALAFLLVNFAHPPKFDDALETVPVEMITASELNQISLGEKTAKPLPVPQRRVDKVAAVAEPKPEPPLAEAKKDVPLPPSPNKPQDDPGEEDKPVPTPPQRVAALPPPQPVPVPRPEPTPPVQQAEPTPPQRPAPEPPKLVAEKQPTPPEKPLVEKEPPPDAETIEPKPVPRPKVEPKKEVKAEPKPEPKPVPTPVVRPPEKKPPVKEAKLELPKPPEPPRKPVEPPKKPEPHFKPDELAKLLEDKKDQKPAPKPKSGSDAKEAPPRAFDPHSISALLDHDAPQRKASTGQKLTQVAALGAPNANAAVLSPSMMAQLADYFTGQYLSCWTYFGLASSANYVPAVRLHLQQDGTLIGQPLLTNPPSDPNQRSLAESAVRAVQKCNPLKIPDRFTPFYDRWRDQIIRFDQKALL